MIDIADMNNKYGISGQAVFSEDLRGMRFVELNNAHGQAVVALQGGHLINWTPRDQHAVIWLSRAASFELGKSIRGGVPVCWPWFGDHARNARFPSHGFARTATWNVISVTATSGGGTRLSLRLEENDATRHFWPFSTELTMSITLGADLEFELVTLNTGVAPITIGEALHAYFEVGDVRTITITGLDGCEYLDKVDGMTRKRQTGSIAFSAETDRVYLDTVSDCVIDDPVFGRRIRVSKQGSRSTVVWNPWKEKAAKMADLGDDGYLKMVCVETANAADNTVTLAAGKEHRLATIYRVETLPSLRL